METKPKGKTHKIALAQTMETNPKVKQHKIALSDNGTKPR